jgi:hypothetical protein
MERAMGIEPIAQVQSLTTTLFSSAIFDTSLVDGKRLLRQVADDVKGGTSSGGIVFE